MGNSADGGLQIKADIQTLCLFKTKTQKCQLISWHFQLTIHLLDNLFQTSIDCWCVYFNFNYSIGGTLVNK